MTILIQTARAIEGTYEVGLSVFGDLDAADMGLHTKVSGRRYPTEQEAASAALAAVIRELEQQKK
jgi:hypothetical protein